MPAIRTIRLDSIDSTSSHARRLFTADPGVAAEPFVIVARIQTGGRGQFARTWASPEGGLWCTHVFPAESVSPHGLGLRIGIACARTVEGALRRAGNGNDVRLKWPNDVYILGKKVLGVLTETISALDMTGTQRRAVLVGVGINANFASSQLPPDIAPRATTILERTGTPTDLGALLAELSLNLDRAIRTPGLDPATLAEARFRLHAVGQEADVRTTDGHTIRGVLEGLDDTGLPVFRTVAGNISGVSIDPGW